MTKTPSASARLAKGLVLFAESRGLSREAIMSQAGLSFSSLSSPDARIDIDAYQNLIHTIQNLANDPSIALKWGAEVDLAELSIVGLIANSSRTMGDAFEQLQRYEKLALDLDITGSQPRLELVIKNDQLWMVDKRNDPNSFPELSETAFARLACGPRQFLKKQHVLEVHFSYPDPGYAAVYDQVFKCPVTFSSHWNALRLHPETSTWPIATQPDYAFEILTDYANQKIENDNYRKTTRHQVEQYLNATLHTGKANADEAAQRLGISRQTLYRKLKSESTSFREIIKDTRQALATEYLSSDNLSVSETAYLLGYSDPAAFSRAFKRNTGLSPRSSGIQ
ncbi:MAG: AraC family transcriptional regulator [Henriciella sp.]|jgi:AraC-like DNA-binding protein